MWFSETIHLRKAWRLTLPQEGLEAHLRKAWRYRVNAWRYPEIRYIFQNCPHPCPNSTLVTAPGPYYCYLVWVHSLLNRASPWHLN